MTVISPPSLNNKKNVFRRPCKPTLWVVLLACYLQRGVGILQCYVVN